MNFQTIIQRFASADPIVFYALVIALGALILCLGVMFVAVSRPRVIVNNQAVQLPPEPTLTEADKALIAAIATRSNEAAQVCDEILVSRLKVKTLNPAVKLTFIKGKAEKSAIHPTDAAEQFIELLRVECAMHQWGELESNDALRLRAPRTRAKLPSQHAAA